MRKDRPNVVLLTADALRADHLGCYGYGRDTSPVLDEFAAAGTPERARDELEKFTAVDGVDNVSIGFPRAATPEEIDATLDAFAPE